MDSGVIQIKKIGLGLFIGLVFFFASLIMFNTTQASLIGIIAFLVTLWTNEGLPLAVVSLLPIILFPSFSILSTKAKTVNYANPIIYLFLGGFVVEIAVETTGLHSWIAEKALSVFPSTPRGIIIALSVTSGVLGSLLSKTTTALLLLP
ncbi:MAG TPA: anion transporter, partial [Helicobacteraceae bacterium]|nr:anion transporter [Helicobacteraceae bacterium]